MIWVSSRKTKACITRVWTSPIIVAIWAGLARLAGRSTSQYPLTTKMTAGKPWRSIAMTNIVMSITSTQLMALEIPSWPLLPFFPLIITIKKILTSFHHSPLAPLKIRSNRHLQATPLPNLPDSNPMKLRKKKSKGN